MGAFENRIKRWVKKNIKKQANDNTELVLFGCVPMAKKLRDALAEFDLSISAIVDNNSEKCGQECLGTVVHLPDKYLVPHKENIIVMIWHDVYWKEMVKQVKGMGYSDSQIAVFHTFPIIKDNLSFKADFYSTLHAYKGWRFYNKVIKGTDFLFLCPYKGTGDVYLAGGYFHQYLKREGINRYKVLVVSKTGAKVAKLFGMENIMVISKKQCERLLLAYDLLGEQMKLKPLLYWGWRTKRFVIQRFCKEINFDDMFKYDVYNMPIEAKRDCPVFATTSEYVEKFFDDNGLVKGKTVVLAPYAGSFTSDIPVAFWEKLACKFIEMGYVVVTNCSSENEKTILGTKSIFFDLSDTVPILENAGVFIGLRSGLCDIASTAKCKKVVFYESGFNASQFEFFNLNALGLCNDAIEIVFNGEDSDTFLDITLNRMLERRA